MASKSNKPEPNFRTPQEQYCGVEKIKIAANMVRGRLKEEFADHTVDDLSEESEAIAKSHGVYLEYNRARTGKEKDWMYMVRISVPGGGGFTREQWRVFDDLSNKWGITPSGAPTLRVTTRQNIQFHWIKKPGVTDIVRTIAQTGFFTLNGCGDNTRNVMGCPLSAYSNVFNAHEKAKELGAYFRLPAEPHIAIFGIDPNYIRTPEEHYEYTPRLLNRKFKIAVSAVHFNEEAGAWYYDNCVELRTDEIGIAPILENGQVEAFQVYIGGSQGEKNGKPTAAMLGKPLGVFTQANLLKGLDAIVHVHEEWGDRQNRHWARMKYLVQAKGIAWYQDCVRERGGEFEQPIADFDPGPRYMHHGWHKQPSNGRWAFGCYIENGRLQNGENGRIKSMVRGVMEKYQDLKLITTPNQDILFCDLPEEAKHEFEADLRSYGWGERHGKPYSPLRLLSGACVGLHTCRLAYTESEQFEPELIDQLDAMGYGDMRESIGITGCERQCFRPSTKTLGWIGQGPNIYSLRLGGSEDARGQGHGLVENGRWFLRQVPRDQVAVVCASLFDFYKTNRLSPQESMGEFHRRAGAHAIIEHLKADDRTSVLTEKTYDAPYIPEPSI